MNLHNDVYNWLLAFEESDKKDDPDSCSILEFYESQLPRLIDETISKVRNWCENSFPNADDLVEYMQYCDGNRSLDRIKHWDVELLRSCTSSFEALQEALGENLPYLIAAGMLGQGVGLWEIFDDFPDLYCLS